MGDGIAGHGHFAKQEEYTQKATGNGNQGSSEDDQQGIVINGHGLREG